MQIFNVQIFGEDKEQWLKQTVEEKVEWIRKYTNQQDDAIIEEFVNNPKVSKDRICLTCSTSKHEEKNIKEIEVVSETVSEEQPKVKRTRKK